MLQDPQPRTGNGAVSKRNEVAFSGSRQKGAFEQAIDHGKTTR